MTVTVIVQLQASAGKGERLRELVTEMMVVTKTADGALGHEMLYDLDDPDKVIVLERWRARSDHEAYRAWRLRTSAGVADLAAVLGGRPTVTYAQAIAES